jgi:KDO2-lipid IV(A) lauroyltransferase
MKLEHALTTALARTLIAGVRALEPATAAAAGSRLGDVARGFGLRRAVAERNLALAFPDRDAAFRRDVLREHYRELGRVCAEYARLAELVNAEGGAVVREVRGMEHLLRARDEGRGAILLTGHFGNFELAGAWLGRAHPLDFVVKPLSNPGMERWIADQRQRAGVGQIPLGAGMRGAFAALKANRWVAMLADQDARRHGVFVPFFGTPASTPVGPAMLSLRTGAPIIMGFDQREADGRHVIEVEPPLRIADPGAPDAVARLTAAHTAALEERIRRRPHAWFWLHRRWKTPPP